MLGQDQCPNKHQIRFFFLVRRSIASKIRWFTNRPHFIHQRNRGSTRNQTQCIHKSAYVLSLDIRNDWTRATEMLKIDVDYYELQIFIIFFIFLIKSKLLGDLLRTLISIDITWTIQSVRNILEDRETVVSIFHASPSLVNHKWRCTIHFIRIEIPAFAILQFHRKFIWE